MIKLDRFLFSSVVYPTDYGFIPDTLSLDGDPLDVMVLVSEPTFPGCMIEVKPIGLFRMEDDQGIDDKVLAVPLTDPGWNTLESLDGVSEQLQNEIAHFFTVYKQLENKKVEVDGWYPCEDALKVIAASRDAVQRRVRERPLGFRRRVAPRGNRPRDHAGADGVPADLEHRAPAHHSRVRGLGGPWSRVHRGDPARHDGRGAPLLPPRPRPDRARVAALAARPGGAARARCAARLVHPARDDPDRDLRPGLQGPDRDGRARPLRDRHRADRARIGAAGGGAGGQSRPSAREDHKARRHRDRICSGAGADPGGVTLGCDAHRRSVHGPGPDQRGALLVSPVHPGGRAERRWWSSGRS